MDQVIKRQVEAGNISQDTATSIMDHISGLMVDNGITQVTAQNHAAIISRFCVLLGKPPAEATTAEVKRVYGKMRAEFKSNAFRAYLSLSRSYLRWLQPPGVDLTQINNIKAPRPDSITKTAAGMLTEQEIKQMIESCDNARDIALIAMMYEGGFRPGELRKLTWGEISFDQYGLIINTDVKTGVPRYIRLITSTQLLAAWRNEYPAGEPRGTSPVFVTIHGKPKGLSHNGVRKIIAKVSKKAGVGKPVSPYTFRHSRITNMIRQGIPESVIRLQHWGTLKTNMLSTYAHVTGEHIDDILLAHAGIRDPEQPGKGLRAMDPVQCLRCHTINPPTAQWCYRCGFSFSDDQITFEEFISYLMQNPDDMIHYAEWRKSHPEIKWNDYIAAPKE